MIDGDRVEIETLCAAAGCRFGCTQNELEAHLTPRYGAPAARVNFDGELELSYGIAIFRLRADRFVECTFPDRPGRAVRAVIDGLPVLYVYEWLGAQPDCADIAFFRISREVGIAYDRRGPVHHSYTVFAAGHWDGLF